MTGAAAQRSVGFHELHLESSGQAIFACVDAPDGVTGRTGVVVCAPFGWDELCTHRSMRALAGALAHAGHPTIRFDLPGTGDSAGSPRDPDLVARWCAAVTDAASWIGETYRCPRVVAFGIGLGGMLATRAVADGAPIDDLVLWGVPARGSTLLRELRTFATMAGTRGEPLDGHVPPASDDASLQAAGFVVSEATLRELDALDLTSLAIPEPHGRRVLLLGRDSLPPDRRLRAHLAESGVEVEVGDGDGFGDMVTHPQFARRPEAVIARVARWVDDGGDAPRAHRAAARAPAAIADASIDGVVERPFDIDYGGRRLTGVLSEPAGAKRSAAPLCVVLLNAGSIRRIGPNRMWVEAARRWAAQGIPTLRFDAVGLGDSDGDEAPYVENGEFYLPAGPEQVRAALDQLEAAGLPGRFVVGGLCSGAYWAMHAAREDPRILGTLLINLWAFVWTEELVAARERGNTRGRLRRTSIVELVRTALGRGQVSVGDGLRAAARALRPTPRRVRDEPAADAFAAIAERGTETLLLFCAAEPLFADLASGGWLERIAGWPRVTLERVPIADHTFRPVWAQRLVHERLDEAVARSVARASAPSA